MDRKSMGLRRGKSPQQHPVLSGTATLVEQGVRVINVRFCDALPKALGRKMPRGLSINDPGMLKVLYLPTKKLWRVFCIYIYENRGVVIQEYKERPHWLGNLRDLDDYYRRQQEERDA